MSAECVYGFPCVTNPHDFTPDEESCSPEEIAAHKAACQNWGKPTFRPNKGCFSVHSDDGQIVTHVTRTSWGIGVNTLTKCDHCGEIANETIHCWDCGGDFCCASCWPKHNEDSSCS